MGKLSMILLPVLVVAAAARNPVNQDRSKTGSEPGNILPDWSMARLRYDGCRIYAEFEPKDLSGKMCEEKGELRDVQLTDFNDKNYQQVENKVTSQAKYTPLL
ncbi:hypothetical protein Bbelb_117330 [Branchiostoma belcheri]|nr:hypothetical protein Bbelb_117330 [Branchiostoma belcheri]